MTTEATTPDAVRRRLLDGVLLRLARRPDAHEFVLRGGVLLRHWFHLASIPHPRPVEDIDLVATFEFDIEEAARRFLPVFEVGGVGDGVVYDTEAIRYEGIWLETGTPGMRVFAAGWLAGAGGVGRTEIDFHVDITFGPYPSSAPVFVALPTLFGTDAEVWACRPEAVVGHKVQAIWHRAMLGWRPKDLNDLRLLLARVPLDAADLRESIRWYLADVGATEADARELFGPAAWWGMKLSSARWRDFADASRGQGVPRDLAGIVAEVAARLVPFLEGVS